MSVNMLVTEKRIITEVLQMYKEYTCLWDQTDLNYNKKEARKQAHNALLAKYKVACEDANIDSMKRKIDNMRTSYKREQKKVIRSIERGDDPVYKPSLWYFKLMSFIDGKSADDTTNSVDQSTDCEDNEEEHGSSMLRSMLKETYSDNQDIAEEYINVDENYEIQYYDSELEEEPKPKKTSLASVYVAEGEKKKQKKGTSLSDHVYTKKSGDARVHGASSTVEESEAFGTTVGLQLQQLDGFQRTVAEKLISEVIFYGRLNKLSANSFFNLNADKYN